eukprot:jgi/Mesvir1/27478/Mv07253-RA.1
MPPQSNTAMQTEVYVSAAKSRASPVVGYGYVAVVQGRVVASHGGVDEDATTIQKGKAAGVLAALQRVADLGAPSVVTVNVVYEILVKLLNERSPKGELRPWVEEILHLVDSHGIALEANKVEVGPELRLAAQLANKACAGTADGRPPSPPTAEEPLPRQGADSQTTPPQGAPQQGSWDGLIGAPGAEGTLVTRQLRNERPSSAHGHYRGVPGADGHNRVRPGPAEQGGGRVLNQSGLNAVVVDGTRRGDGTRGEGCQVAPDRDAGGVERVAVGLVDGGTMGVVERGMWEAVS